MLVLVRHAAVAVDRIVPSAEWQLTPDGRRLAAALARHPALAAVEAFFSSPEPKAVATAMETLIVTRKAVFANPSRCLDRV